MRREVLVNIVHEELRATGRPALEFVNGGGTGSIETTRAESVITEIGAGSGIMYRLVRSLQDFQTDPGRVVCGACRSAPRPEHRHGRRRGRVASAQQVKTACR